MKMLIAKSKRILTNVGGMEMVQVAILVAIAIVIGIVFKNQIGDFVNGIFNTLTSGTFTDPI